MRQSGSWMTIWDDRILEIIQSDDDGIGKVSNLKNHENIQVGQSQVSRRCSKLAENGLLRRIGNGVYVITDEGKAYLEGKYDAENHRFINGGGSSEDDGEAGATDGPGINS
ncbi:PhiH1 repressor [Halosimplex halobium]|uniref:PhiH1 repressor n=1 Tax=Halosimplex halobium TaxID=3396618 RepID=UPI003F5796E0